MDAMIFIFLMTSFKSAFSLSYFTFIKKLFSYSSLSAIRVVSFAYLRLLTFFPAIFIPACASFSLAFHIRSSAYKLNKQGDNITALTHSFLNLEPVRCSMSSSVTSWPAYRFHRRQIRWSCILISFRIFHSLLWFTQSKHN